MRRRVVVTGALLVGLLLASCGTTTSDVSVAGTSSDERTAPAEAAAGAPPASSTGAETSTPPARQPAGGVVLAGDSIAGEVAPALAEALADQPAPFAFVVQPNLAGYAALQAEWEARLAELDPWVVVLLLGTWERIVVTPDQPGWQERYVQDVLRPFVQQLTTNGTQVVAAEYPPLEDNADLPGSGGLNDVWAALPEQLPGVSFVDAGGVLRGPDGAFTRDLPFPTVGDVQVRQTDGRHLCPDGVMLVADRILSHLQQLRPALVPREGWQRGPWRDDPANFEHPELCPSF